MAVVPNRSCPGIFWMAASEMPFCIGDTGSPSVNIANQKTRRFYKRDNDK